MRPLNATCCVVVDLLDVLQCSPLFISMRDQHVPHLILCSILDVLFDLTRYCCMLWLAAFAAVCSVGCYFDRASGAGSPDQACIIVLHVLDSRKPFC